VLMTPSDPRLHKTIYQHSSHPPREACSSRAVGSFTEAPALARYAHVDGSEQAGNKQPWNTTEHNDRQRHADLR
jgi:hypothetical protein